MVLKKKTRECSECGVVKPATPEFFLKRDATADELQRIASWLYKKLGDELKTGGSR